MDCHSVDSGNMIAVGRIRNLCIFRVIFIPSGTIVIMAAETILHLPSNSTALRFLTALYKNSALKIQSTTESVIGPQPYTWPNFQIPRLVLENGQEITGENTISEFLGETHQKINWTPELRAEAHELLSRSAKFATSPEEVYVLNPPDLSWSKERRLIVGWLLGVLLLGLDNLLGLTTFYTLVFILLWWDLLEEYF
jgi:hypothetical protein